MEYMSQAVQQYIQRCLLDAAGNGGQLRATADIQDLELTKSRYAANAVHPRRALACDRGSLARSPMSVPVGMLMMAALGVILVINLGGRSRMGVTATHDMTMRRAASHRLAVRC
jgi:hypothetical protein